VRRACQHGYLWLAIFAYYGDACISCTNSYPGMPAMSCIAKPYYTL